MPPDDAGITAVCGTISKATIALVLFIGNLVVVNLIRGLPRRNLYAEAIAFFLSVALAYTASANRNQTARK
jgi:hypothetical protein